MAGVMVREFIVLDAARVVSYKSNNGHGRVLSLTVNSLWLMDGIEEPSRSRLVACTDELRFPENRGQRSSCIVHVDCDGFCLSSSSCVGSVTTTSNRCAIQSVDPFESKSDEAGGKPRECFANQNSAA